MLTQCKHVFNKISFNTHTRVYVHRVQINWWRRKILLLEIETCFCRLHRSAIQITFVCVCVFCFYFFYVRVCAVECDLNIRSWAVFSPSPACELVTCYITLKHFTASATRSGRLRFFDARNKCTDWKYLVSLSAFYVWKKSITIKIWPWLRFTFHQKYKFIKKNCKFRV